MSSVRALVATTAAFVLCTSLTACTGNDGASDGGTESPSPSAGESSATAATPTTLKFAVYGDDAATIDSYTRLIERFESERPDVNVKLVKAPDAATSAAEVRSQLAAGQGPDLFVARHDDVPELVDAGEIQPVDELLEERDIQFGDGYERIGLEAFAADSHLQCMPHDVSPLVVYYNKELLKFRRLEVLGGLPTAETGWSWEQFVAAASNMSQRDVKGVYLEPSLDTLMAFVRSDGSDIVDDPSTPTTLTLSEGGTREALEEILTLARNPLVTPTREAVVRKDAVTRFRKGQIGMMLGTRALTPVLRDTPGLRFDVMPLPRLGRYRTISEITGYCIAADSANQDLTADFLAFAIGEEGASITAESGGIVPSNLVAQHSKAFLQPARRPRHTQVFIDAVRRSDSTPFVAGWNDVVRATANSVERMFYDPVLDLDTLLPMMDEQSARILNTETGSEEAD